MFRASARRWRVWATLAAALLLMLTAASAIVSVRIQYTTASLKLAYTFDVGDGVMSVGWIPPDRTDGAIPISGFAMQTDVGEVRLRAPWRPVHCAGAHWPDPSEYHFLDVPLWIPLLLSIVAACGLQGRARRVRIRTRAAWVWTIALISVAVNVATIRSCASNVIAGWSGSGRILYVELAGGALRLNGGSPDEGNWQPHYFDEIDGPPHPGFWCTWPQSMYRSEELDLGVLPSKYLGGFSVPLWLPSLLSLALASYLVGGRRAKAPSLASCARCCYDLGGLAAKGQITCPECGQPAAV
jgi:hypothetical protein